LHNEKPSKTISFSRFFEGLEVQYGPKIEEESLKMALLAPRWAALNDFGVMLRHVGGKMATKRLQI